MQHGCCRAPTKPSTSQLTYFHGSPVEEEILTALAGRRIPEAIKQPVGAECRHQQGGQATAPAWGELPGSCAAHFLPFPIPLSLQHAGHCKPSASGLDCSYYMAGLEHKQLPRVSWVVHLNFPKSRLSWFLENPVSLNNISFNKKNSVPHLIKNFHLKFCADPKGMRRRAVASPHWHHFITRCIRNKHDNTYPNFHQLSQTLYTPHVF